MEKLASGYKINHAGDDAAGLAISEKMRAQITALSTAKSNSEDGISLVQTVEGALNEVHTMLNRIKQISVQSANGIYSDSDRLALDHELQELKDEIGRIGKSTKWGNIRLFKDSSDNLTATVTDNTISAIPSGWRQLADKIANEYVPNGISQIFNAFPALKNAVGSDSTGMELLIEYIDGENNTLASAGYSYNTSDFSVISMKITIDSSDYSDDTLTAGEYDVGRLESTIAHELMHTVMQYTMTEEMSGQTASNAFPKWFKEGTAQLSGGGFPTNWNNTLKSYANTLTNINDTSKDADIKTYLKKYDAQERPYGHGYLLCAYLGFKSYKESGGIADNVCPESISEGMNLIFENILNGENLYKAISNRTNLTVDSTADLETLLDNPSNEFVEFIRRLSYNTQSGPNDGAGSVITSDFSDSGSSILGNSISATLNDPFFIKTFGSSGTSNENHVIKFHVGDDSTCCNSLYLNLYKLDSEALGLENANLLTQDSSLSLIDTVEDAVKIVSEMRAQYGAVQNRLEHTINNLCVTIENITGSESQIRDTNMAEEMMAYTKNNVLIQSAQAMLAQANTIPQAVLELVG